MHMDMGMIATNTRNVERTVPHPPSRTEGKRLAVGAAPPSCQSTRQVRGPGSSFRGHGVGGTRPELEMLDSRWRQRGRARITSAAQARKPADHGGLEVLLRPKKEQTDLRRRLL